MSFAKILVPVVGSARDGSALATAFAAARPFNAHVDVMFVHSDPREAVPYTEINLTPSVVQSIVDSAEQVARRASKVARQTLTTAAAQAEVKIVDVPAQTRNGVTASYRETVGHLPRTVAEAALLSDLVVFPPMARDDDPEVHDAFVRILTRTKRPVLLAPGTAPAGIGYKIAIGWDGRDAAAHAMLSALPYLSKAKEVEILSVRPVTSASTTADVRNYLAYHGLSCSERNIDPVAGRIADVLLDTALASGCDLLVVGGYGHSRLAESIFGGVTESLVSHPKLPIFMVH